MSRGMKLCCLILKIVLLETVIFYVYQARDVFKGESVKTADVYILRFEEMTGSDRHVMSLAANDELAIVFDIVKGRADITIGAEGQESVYTGNDIDSCEFKLVVPDDGDYAVTVKAKHAAGTIDIRKTVVCAK